MLKPEQYTKLYNFLKHKSLKLINSSEEYSFCHEFPNSYSMLKAITPSILTFSMDSSIAWKTVKKEFEKFMMKDFVKSVKGNDFPQYFDSSYSDIQLDEYVKKFIELRGDLYTGGIVLKQYMSLAKTYGNTNEYRAFYLNGNLSGIFYFNAYEVTLCLGLQCLIGSFYTIKYLRQPIHLNCQVYPVSESIQ